MGLPLRKEEKAGFKISKSEMGSANTLRFNVLTAVVNEEYDQAADELQEFVDMDSPYPDFKQRLERYVQHAIDLVYAIRAKRSFPGMASLTYAKQQELIDKYLGHFDELKVTLIRIEAIQNSMKTEDIKSTVIVLKAFVNAVFAIAVVAWVLELSSGLLKTGLLVTEDALLSLSEWLFNLLGL
jgi:hypothetical protein